MVEAPVQRDPEPLGAPRRTANSRTPTARCGADVWRCPVCDRAVGPSQVRSGVNHYGACANAAPFPSTCRQWVAERGARCRFHGRRSPQAKRAAIRRARQRVATSALARVERVSEARRAALEPFAAQIAEAEREADLGGDCATVRLRSVARALRVASERLYDEARRREAGAAKREAR